MKKTVFARVIGGMLTPVLAPAILVGLVAYILVDGARHGYRLGEELFAWIREWWQ